MLWCDTAGEEARDIEDLAVFVSQLDALGVPAHIPVDIVPPGLNRNVQFDLAPYLRDAPMAADDRLVLLAAHALKDAKLASLRRLAAGTPRACIAYGTFGSRQGAIGTTAKLAYVLEQEPEVIDLATAGPTTSEPGATCPLFGVARRSVCPAKPRLLVVAPALNEPREVAALTTLALSNKLDVAVLTDGRSKQEWLQTHAARLAIYHYGEVLPVSLAERVDLCALFAPLDHNYRLQCLVANLAASGAALLDCTVEQSLVATMDAFVRGPSDVANLALMVNGEVLPNLDALATHVRSSTMTARLTADVLGPLNAARVPPTPAHPSVDSPHRIVFMPTNGVGLGHAQRCTLIATEFERGRATPVFAAFPSCGGLVKAYGFDTMPLVPRSVLHAQTHENDLTNYLRLRSLAETADVIVFDGGYIFDSVYRTILERGLPGVWIRRGLWQARQDNIVPLDREKAFARVIVPSEAFSELNLAYSAGDHVRTVGPITQCLALTDEQRTALRAELGERYDLDFEHLVVTQLGGGIAADRSAQIQSVCGLLERRTDVLHLVVVWPTTVLQPGWFGWSRTRVVKTRHAGVLVAAADLCVSAAGYNSFHEVLYGAIPTIFVPQTASFMDDQHARARAAEERGLAALVEPHQLMTLDRTITRHLDAGETAAVRERLRALDLPEPGNAHAAEIIQELAHADDPLARSPVAHRAG